MDTTAMRMARALFALIALAGIALLLSPAAARAQDQLFVRTTNAGNGPVDVALDLVNDELYVVSEFARAILVFPRTANGNVAPTRALQGPNTGLNFPYGIALEATGECVSALGPRVTTQVGPGATPTFAIFVAGNGLVPFDPAANRVFVRFTDGGGTVRGATSVAGRTQ